MMAESVSDDRAIEVLVRSEAGQTIFTEDEQGPWPGTKAWEDEAREKAKELVEALASAGFQITDLTAEEATRCVAALDSERDYLGADVVGYNDDLKAKLRRLSGVTGG